LIVVVYVTEIFVSGKVGGNETDLLKYTSIPSRYPLPSASLATAESRTAGCAFRVVEITQINNKKSGLLIPDKLVREEIGLIYPPSPDILILGAWIASPHCGDSFRRKIVFVFPCRILGYLFSLPPALISFYFKFPRGVLGVNKFTTTFAVLRRGQR
jgi:hypothetical protein